MSLTVKQLAERIGAELRGDGSRTVTRCAGLTMAGPHDVSFLANKRYRQHLASTKAAAVVLSAEDAEQAGNLTVLVADDPYFAFRQAIVEIHGFHEDPPPGVSDRAIVDATATLGPDCSVLPHVYVDAGAKVGRRCVLHPNCYIGAGAVIGDECRLFPNVTIYHGCVLGDRVTLHAGCVIGQDGFGYATHEGAHHKIPQVGNVVIESDVEMGANCVVDRGAVGSTRIGAGTKFSDLIAIGHGTVVGRHNLLVAQVGLAGSVETGDYVSMGGQVGVAGHLKIGNFVQIAATSALKDDVPDKTSVGGAPAVPLNIAKRNWLAWTQLGNFARDVRRLKKKVAELERQAAESGP